MKKYLNVESDITFQTIVSESSRSSVSSDLLVNGTNITNQMQGNLLSTFVPSLCRPSVFSNVSFNSGNNIDQVQVDLPSMFLASARSECNTLPVFNVRKQLVKPAVIGLTIMKEI